MLRYILSCLAILAGIPAAAAQDACALAPGMVLVLDDLDAVLRGVSQQPREKDPFETTAEFEARRAAAGAGPETVVLASDADQRQAIYDADRAAWFLTGYFPSNATLGFVDYALQTAGLIGYGDRDRIEYVMLRSEDVPLGDYTAANAMGASLTVRKSRHTRVAIAEVGPKTRSGYKIGTELFAYADTVQVKSGTEFRSQPALRIDMPRDRARAINGRIGFAVVADLVDPLRVEGRHHIAPKFDNPYDRQVETTVLLADIRCGIAYGPDLSVLAVVGTRPPY